MVGAIRVGWCGALILTSVGWVLAVEAYLIRYASGLVFRRGSGAERAVPVRRFDRATAPPKSADTARQACIQQNTTQPCRTPDSP